MGHRHNRRQTRYRLRRTDASSRIELSLSSTFARPTSADATSSDRPPDHATIDSSITTINGLMQSIPALYPSAIFNHNAVLPATHDDGFDTSSDAQTDFDEQHDYDPTEHDRVFGPSLDDQDNALCDNMLRVVRDLFVDLS